MGIRLITAPVDEPISLDEAKAHLRIIDTDDDTLITALIKAARSNCENWTGRALIDQTWELALDGFPTSDTAQSSTFITSTFTSAAADLAILVPKPPLIEIVQVAYDDESGIEQIMDTADYYVDNYSEPGWLVFSGITSWPATIDAVNSVRVQFRAGYITSDSPQVANVPEDIKAAIKLTLGSLYEHRETQVIGSIASKLPFGVEYLLRSYRVQLGMA